MACLQPISEISSFSNKFNSFALLQIEKFGTVEYWIKNFKLPGLSQSPEEIKRYDHSIFVPGNLIGYNEFSCSVFLDENFITYKTMHEWMMNYVPDTFDDDYQSVAALLVFNNNRTEIVAKFTFEGFMLKNLSDFEFINSPKIEDLILELGFTYDKITPEFAH